MAARVGPAQYLREHVVDGAPTGRSGVVVGDEAQPSVGEDQSAPARFDDARFFRGQQRVGGVSEQFQRALQIAARDVAGRGGHQQGGPGGVGEPGQRREMGVAQPFAGGERVVEGQVSGALARGEDGRQFGEGERVALGDGEQPVGDESAQRVRGGPLEQGPRVDRVQRSEPQLRYAGDDGAQVGSGGGAAVFGREEQDDRLFGDAPRHEEQCLPRRGVEQMRVVDREQERTPCGRGAEQSEHRRADREPGVPRPLLSGGQQMAEQVALGCGQAWQIAAVGLDDLVQTRVAQPRFGCGAHEIHRADGVVEGEDPAEQGGPSQPRFPYDEQRATAPGRRVTEQPGHRGCFSDPPEHILRGGTGIRRVAPRRRCRFPPASSLARTPPPEPGNTQTFTLPLRPSGGGTPLGRGADYTCRASPGQEISGLFFTIRLV
ncbi:hypothetical protein OG798_43245 [Streptomyces sp. NBC_00271]|nr:hypothetical protein [Streptomyces sp. NBC_00271]